MASEGEARALGPIAGGLYMSRASTTPHRHHLRGRAMGVHVVLLLLKLSPTTVASGGSKNSYWGYLIEEDKGQWQALFSHLSHLFHTSRGDYKSQVILQLISMS